MISGHLEYLMSSLPHLSFRNTEEEQLRVSTTLHKYAQRPEEPVSLAKILEQEAAKFLSEKKAALFRAIDLRTIHQTHFQESTCRVLADFAAFMFRQKKDVEGLRKARRAGSEQSVKDWDRLIQPGNPLEEEVQLMQHQWQQLEKGSIGYYADFGALVIYKLKLLILERWWGFDQEQGMTLFLQTTERT